MSLLPASIRRLTPDRLRDDVHMRALGVGLGLIPPRTMHSAEDARVLRDAARGARRVIEIGVYEGASALVLYQALGPEAELHLIDPFGRHSDALPSGWGGTEWATRRVLAGAARRRGAPAPRLCWHVALSQEVASTWSGQVDVVFIDGDHSEAGCELDWSCWSRFIAVGGCAIFHDARAGLPGGRGLPGPTAIVTRHFRGAQVPGFEVSVEADRTVVVRRVA